MHTPNRSLNGTEIGVLLGAVLLAAAIVAGGLFATSEDDAQLVSSSNTTTTTVAPNDTATSTTAPDTTSTTVPDTTTTTTTTVPDTTTTTTVPYDLTVTHRGIGAVAVGLSELELLEAVPSSWDARRVEGYLDGFDGWRFEDRATTTLVALTERGADQYSLLITAHPDARMPLDEVTLRPGQDLEDLAAGATLTLAMNREYPGPETLRRNGSPDPSDRRTVTVRGPDGGEAGVYPDGGAYVETNEFRAGSTVDELWVQCFGPGASGCPPR